MRPINKYVAALFVFLFFFVSPAFAAIPRPKPRVIPVGQNVNLDIQELSDDEFEERYQALLERYPNIQAAASRADIRWILRSGETDPEVLQTLEDALAESNRGNTIIVPDEIPIEGELTARELQEIRQARAWLDIKEDLELREIDRKALSLVKEFAKGTNVVEPTTGQNGAITYLYGSLIPRIVCRPNRVTDVALQPGEHVTGVHIGDGIRWQISPANSGSGSSEVVHVMLKPLMPDISTNLVIMTDRRTYNLDLVSSATEFIPSVKFHYPQDTMDAWASFIAATKEKRTQTTELEPSYSIEVENLNFEYKISSKKRVPWQPLRVFDDGTKTYIQMPKSYHSSEAPVLIFYDGRRQRLVNYRVKGDLYIVDRLIATKAVMLADKNQVVIVREK